MRLIYSIVAFFITLSSVCALEKAEKLTCDQLVSEGLHYPDGNLAAPCNLALYLCLDKGIFRKTIEHIAANPDDHDSPYDLSTLKIYLGDMTRTSNATLAACQLFLLAVQKGQSSTGATLDFKEIAGYKSQ